jgi:hypothetical protein
MPPLLVEGLHKMTCGGCGADTVRIYTDRSSLFAQCTGVDCKTVTEITVTAPKLDLRWTEGSDGRLSGWGS